MYDTYTCMRNVCTVACQSGVLCAIIGNAIQNGHTTLNKWTVL